MMLETTTKPKEGAGRGSRNLDPPTTSTSSISTTEESSWILGVCESSPKSSSPNSSTKSDYYVKRWSPASVVVATNNEEEEEEKGVLVDVPGTGAGAEMKKNAAFDQFEVIQRSKRSVVLFRKEDHHHHDTTTTTTSTSWIPVRIHSESFVDTASILLHACSCSCCDRQQDDCCCCCCCCSSTSSSLLAATQHSPRMMTMMIPIDRQEIEEKVRRGEAPLIPPSRSKFHQWWLKRSMDLFFHRRTVEFFAAGPHRMASRCYFDVRRHPGVRGHIALSFDDAPGRLGPGNSLVQDIRKLLSSSKNHQGGEEPAKATFMVVSQFIPGHESDLIQLLQDGHELGNHGCMDQAHDHLLLVDDNEDGDDVEEEEDSAESPPPAPTHSSFLKAIDLCSEQIRSLQQQAGVMMMTTTTTTTPHDDSPTTSSSVRYFRAPHGRYTRKMEEVIQSRNMINVMCDAYASDPVVEDGEYIAKCLLRQARDGGIILLHMPEVGFREHCMVALQKLLVGLQERKLKVVSIGMLEALAQQQEHRTTTTTTTATTATATATRTKTKTKTKTTTTTTT